MFWTLIIFQANPNNSYYIYLFFKHINQINFNSLFFLILLLLFILFIFFFFTTILVVNKAIKALENEKHREFYRDIMIKATTQVESDWAKNRRKRVPQTEPEFQWERKKLNQKMILELEHEMKKSFDVKSVNEQREKEEEKQAIEKLKDEAKTEQVWEETRDTRVSSWRDWQSTGSATKKQKLGFLRPPKVMLLDGGVELKRKADVVGVVEEKEKEK